MSNYRKYDEDFKKSLVNLYHGGKTQTALRKEYGVSAAALSKWIKLYSEVQIDDGAILTAKQIKELQKKNALLEEENLILKKSNCHLHTTLKQRLDAIHLLRFEHSIVRICKVLNVNRITYYKHFHSDPSPRTVENQKLRQLIWTEYMKSDKRLSATSMHIVLSRDYGTTISSGRVYRLMKSMDLPKMSTVKPTFRYHKPAVSLDYPNILNQQFDPNEPNRAWVSDITYIPVKNKFVYLCVILDLFSRKVIAWKLSHRMTTSLVIDTLDTALNHRQPNESVLFHSDRGSQYTSVAFRQFLDTHNLIASYSKPGYPYDNAVIESFFKYLKRDELSRRNFHSLEEVSLATFSYIEGWYNNKRPHSHNKMLTPNEKEEQFYQL